MFGQTEYLYSISLQPQQEAHFFNWGGSRTNRTVKFPNLSDHSTLRNKAQLPLLRKKKSLKSDKNWLRSIRATSQVFSLPKHTVA